MALDNGYAFAIDNVWVNTELDTSTSEDSLFEGPPLRLPQLDSLHELDLEHLALHKDQHAYPDLDELDDAVSDTASHFGDHHSEPDEASEAVDPWCADDVNLPIARSGPTLKMWEAFEKKDIANTIRSAHLTECGAEAYDAALCASEANDPGGVLPMDVSLRALHSLAQGRSSVFYQWDEEKMLFAPTLDRTLTSGLSLQVFNSLISELLEYAGMLRRLRSRTRHPCTPKSCAVVQALFNASATVVDAVEAHVTRDLANNRSMLQLSSMLKTPAEVLEMLAMLIELASPLKYDEEAVSALSMASISIVASGSSLASICKELLAQACRPWLVKLASELELSIPGLTDVPIPPVSASISQHMAADGGPGQQNFEHGDLLRKEDQDLVAASREAVCLLRAHFSADMSGRGNAEVAASSTIGSDANVSLTQDVGPDIWSTDALQQAQSLATPAFMQLTDPSQSTHVALHQATKQSLENIREPELQEATLKPDADPFNLLRPAIESKHLEVNRTLLCHLFDECRLKEHFDLLRAFQLCGSGSFVIRLSTALFSKETQSAERRRGTVPTADTMRLRLGTRQGQRWPPASSELRLTLLDVLKDSYDHSRTIGAQPQQMPGGLSFAIRELPDNEIDKVMNASSLFALDFLRLQYTPPPPLDAIITAKSLQHYDDIFRSLLRICRVQYVTARLRGGPRSVVRPRNASLRFACTAQHVMTTLSTYFVDLAISTPWVCLENSLDQVEKAARDTEAPEVSSIRDLRKEHEGCLDEIRARMFLRRRQANIRAAVDDVLAELLSVASMQHDCAVSEDAYKTFYNAVQHLVDTLQQCMDKSSRTSSGVSSSSEVDMAKMLLVMLNWNGFYCGT